ncbi:TonB-dependent receptor plug domain-containing protein [Chromobacterium paludis]|nr:TonB-dependent receptor [Chromobacterium paludis]
MKVKILAQAIAAIGLLGSGFAHAADAADNQLERVTVVGSNIKRINKEGPSRVEVIKRDEVEQTGAKTAAEALAAITTGSDVVLGEESNSFTAGAAQVGLRRMGSKNTLVLLNGRRIAAYGFAAFDTSFVDLNSIPLSAIDEIQVLYDGASAIYGSDAVAGVVNFKTKQNFQGVRSNATYTQNFAGDGASTVAGVSAGFGDIRKDKQNLLLSLDVTHSEPTYASKHEATRSKDHRRFGGTDDRPVSYFPGTYIYSQTDAHTHAMPGCQGEVSIDDRGDEACRNDINRDMLAPRITRAGASAQYNFQINDNSTLFSELSYYQTESYFSDGSLAISGYDHPIQPGDSAYRAGLGGNTAGGPLRVNRAVYDGPDGYKKTELGAWRGLIGARMTRGDWDSEVGYTYSSNQTKQTDQVLRKDKITDAFQNGGYDPFAMWNPASVVNPLFATVKRDGKATLSMLDFKMSNPTLFTLPAGAAGFAWGASLMRETANDNPDPLLVANLIEGRGATSASGGRSVQSVFGELSIPAAKKLELQLALRYDKYSDFGSTTNPKLAFSYQPLNEVLIRGGYTTNFKAPSLQQLHMGPSRAYAPNYLQDWDRCVPLGYGPGQCKYSPELKVVSNPNLKPERSQNFSFGLVLQPTADLSASFDWYQIKQKDVIQGLDPQYIIDHEDSDPDLAALIERDPRNPALEAKYPGLNKGRLKRITDPFVNVGKVDTSGIDTDIKYAIKLGDLGKLTFRNQNSYLLSYKQSEVAGMEMTQRKNSRYYPNWDNRLTVEYEIGKWDTLVTAHTNARVHDVTEGNKIPSNPDTYVPSYTTYNLAITYRLNKSGKVTLGVNNLFGKDSPFSVDKNDFVGLSTGRSGFVGIEYRLK